MINLSTHQGAEHALGKAAVPVRRIGPRSFALLLAVELTFVVGVLIWATYWLTPHSTPYAPASDIGLVVDAVRERVSGAVPDALVEVSPGVSARESSLRGFKLGDTTYYYYLEGGANFDPFSQGAVSNDQIEVILRDNTGPQTLVIYRIL